MKRLLFVALLVTSACASRTRPEPTVAAKPPPVRATVVAAESKPAAPRCVDPMKDAPKLADTLAADGTPYIFPLDMQIDLDGDGTKDSVVEVDRDATTVRYELYMMSGGCARHVATVRTEGPIRGPLGRANGFTTLEFVSENRHGELAFDGKSWAISKRWTTPYK